MAQKSLQMCWEYGCEIDRMIDANDYKGLKKYLERQTLRLLELVRECLMYLVYAVDIHERNRDGDGKAVLLVADKLS